MDYIKKVWSRARLNWQFWDWPRVKSESGTSRAS